MRRALANGESAGRACANVLENIIIYYINAATHGRLPRSLIHNALDTIYSEPNMYPQVEPRVQHESIPTAEIRVGANNIRPRHDD